MEKNELDAVEDLLQKLKNEIYPDEVKKQPISDVVVPESSTVRGSFEEQCFAKGVYFFDYDTEYLEANETIEQYEAWLIKNRDRNEVRPRLKEEVVRQNANLDWKKAVSGKVPVSWGESWSRVVDTFEQARKVGATLSEDLNVAGLTHPHHLVVHSVGLSQKLTLEQMVEIGQNEAIPGWNLDDILKAQREKGMTEQEFSVFRQRTSRFNPFSSSI